MDAMKVNRDRRIISRQKCSLCGQGFKDFGLHPADGSFALLCPCGHAASRYTIALYYQSERFNIVGIPYYTNKDRDNPGAQEILARIDSEIAKGTFEPSMYRKRGNKKMAVSSLVVEEWHEDYSRTKLKNGQITPETFRHRRRYVEAFARYFRGRDIRDIRYGHIEDYQNHLFAEGMAPKTVMNYTREFGSFLTWAHLRGYIAVKPPMPPITWARPQKEWCLEEVQEAVLAELDPRDRPIYEFLQTYGCRAGEARAIKWDCITWPTENDIGTVAVRRAFSGDVLVEYTKTRQSYVLPMAAHVEAILRQLAQNRTSEFVFPNPHYPGKPYSKYLIGKYWRQAANKAGVDISLQPATRHSKAMQMLRDGATLKDVADMLNHRSLQTTQGYTSGDAPRLKRWTEKKVVQMASFVKGKQQ